MVRGPSFQRSMCQGLARRGRQPQGLRPHHGRGVRVDEGAIRQRLLEGGDGVGFRRRVLLQGARAFPCAHVGSRQRDDLYAKRAQGSRARATRPRRNRARARRARSSRASGRARAPDASKQRPEAGAPVHQLPHLGTCMVAWAVSNPLTLALSGVGRWRLRPRESVSTPPPIATEAIVAIKRLGLWRRRNYFGWRWRG